MASVASSSQHSNSSNTWICSSHSTPRCFVCLWLQPIWDFAWRFWLLGRQGICTPTTRVKAYIHIIRLCCRYYYCSSALDEYPCAQISTWSTAKSDLCIFHLPRYIDLYSHYKNRLEIWICKLSWWTLGSVRQSNICLTKRSGNFCMHTHTRVYARALWNRRNAYIFRHGQNHNHKYTMTSTQDIHTSYLWGHHSNNKGQPCRSESGRRWGTACTWTCV